MRWRAPQAAIMAAAVLCGSAATAQGILVATDTRAQTGDLRACMMAARKALSGTGLVMELGEVSAYGSNEDRTITIRCDAPGTVFFTEAFFPGIKDMLDPVIAAFEAKGSAGLIASESKSHQFSVDCTRQTSCEIDAAAICKQAYPASAKPAAKVLKSTPCADRQGTYTCSVDYDLNCS